MAVEPPRFLTDGEIEDIVSILPKPQSALDEVQNSSLQSLQTSLKKQLENIKLVPSGIPKFKERILHQYQDSQSIPGTPVGMTAGEAFGGPITQTTLNTFKLAGSATNISGGIAAFKELLEVTQNRKNPVTTINFRDPLTFNQILNVKQNQLAELSVGDLILDYDISPQDQLFAEGRPQWYSWYQELFLPKLSTSQILRLQLNLNRMYSSGLLPGDICRSIMEYQYDQFKIECVYSPILMVKDIVDVTRDNQTETVETLVPRAFIDIYLISSQIQSEEVAKDVSDLHVLNNLVLPSLQRIIILGVPRIKSLTPQTIPIWSGVLSQEFLEDREWLLWFNHINMKTKAISPEDVTNLVSRLGMKIVKKDSEKFRIRMPLEYPGDQPESPKRLLDYYNSRDQQDKTNYETERTKEFNQKFKENPASAIKLQLEWPLSETYRAAHKNIGIAMGNNLYQILMRDDVDPNHTYSNNVYEILANFGIEAARNFLILELIETISAAGSYIDPRHVVLIVDFMTSDGNLKPLTHTGMKQQPTGALARASFERPFEIITPTAIFGSEEPLDSVSGSLFVGKKMPMGTGYNPEMMEINPETEARYEQMLKEGIEIAGNQFSAELDQMDWGVPIELVEEPRIPEPPEPVPMKPAEISDRLLPAEEGPPVIESTAVSTTLMDSLDQIPLPVCEPASDEVPFDITSEPPDAPPVEERVEQIPTEIRTEEIVDPSLGGVNPLVLEDNIQKAQEETDGIELEMFM